MVLCLRKGSNRRGCAMRILIAEDEDEQRKELGVALKRDGHQVTAVSTGLDALNALNLGEPFDLLITDNTMVERQAIGGLELLRLVREGKTAAASTLPIILTSSEDVGQQVMALDGHYLPKPTRRNALRAMIAQVADSKAT